MKINFGAKRLLWLIPMSLPFLVGLTTVPQRTEPQKKAASDWSFSVKQNQVAQSDITARNICFKRHRFHVELENLPFMKLLGPATFQVNAGSDYKDPVTIDATGLKPGDYEGTTVVVCETCPKEKGCTQDRQNLRVRMTVLDQTGALNAQPPSPSTEPARIPEPVMVPRRGCDCKSFSADWPKEGHDDGDKDKPKKTRGVTTQEGAEVEVDEIDKNGKKTGKKIKIKPKTVVIQYGIKGTITTQGADGSFTTSITIQQYLTIKSKGAWAKLAAFPNTLIPMKVECPNKTDFEKWVTLPPFKAEKAAKKGEVVTVDYEIHLYASAEKCPGELANYLQFTVSYDEYGRAKIDKVDGDMTKYNKDKKRKRTSGGSGYGWSPEGMPIP